MYQEMYAMKFGRTRIILKKWTNYCFFNTIPHNRNPGTPHGLACHHVVLHNVILMNRTPPYFSHDRIISLVKRISDNLMCNNGFYLLTQ